MMQRSRLPSAAAAVTVGMRRAGRRGGRDRAASCALLDEPRARRMAIRASPAPAARWPTNGARACDGWTVEQRYRLKMAYAEAADVDISSNFVTWEAKDGLHYRFNQKETRNGDDNEEIRGEAKLDGPDKGGAVEFEKPQAKTLKLPAGVAVSERAHDPPDRQGEGRRELHLAAGLRRRDGGERRAGFGGDRRQGRPRCGGGQEEPAAATGRAGACGSPFSRPTRRPRSPITSSACVLLDNGVSRDMVIDYGEYSIRAKLDDIEALPKPKC